MHNLIIINNNLGCIIRIVYQWVFNQLSMIRTKFNTIGDTEDELCYNTTIKSLLTLGTKMMIKVIDVQNRTIHDKNI